MSDVFRDLWLFHQYNSGKKNNSVKRKFRYQRDLKGGLRKGVLWEKAAGYRKGKGCE